MRDKDNILKKSIISALVFVLFVAIVFYFIFRENSYREIYKIFQSSKKIYLLIGILCMAMFSICESLNLKRTLKLLGTKVKFKDTYKYALGGFFTASITPSASGGDPMQIFLMTKDKIPVSHTLIALLVKLLCFQFGEVSIGLISFILFPNMFKEIGNIKFLVYLGLFLNSLVMILYILLLFFRGIVDYFIKLFSKLLDKIHYKKKEELLAKINKQVIEYSEASKILKKNKLFFLSVLLTAYIQLLLYYAIPYMVYLAFGLNNASLITFIAIQSVLFLSVSALPFPGSVGVSEGTFMYLYKNLFGSLLLGSAMVITRFINFYIFVLYSGIMLLVLIFKDNLKKIRNN